MDQHGSFGLPVPLPRAAAMAALLATLPCPGFAAALQTDERPAMDELWLFLDRDGDGRVSRYEGAEAFLLLADEADGDGDGALTAGEVRAFLREAREAETEERIGGFIAFDRNEDQELEQHELPDELRGQFDTMDGDGDGVVTLEELLEADELVLAVGEDLMRFRVEGTRAFMTGVIGPATPARVLELLLEHPAVDTIVLSDVPGSMDDDSMLRAARMVRRAGLATHVSSGARWPQAGPTSSSRVCGARLPTGRASACTPGTVSARRVQSCRGTTRSTSATSTTTGRWGSRTRSTGSRSRRRRPTASTG